MITLGFFSYVTSTGCSVSRIADVGDIGDARDIGIAITNAVFRSLLVLSPDLA